MGIRYFAVSVDLEDYERVSAGPCPTCGARQHPREREDYFDESVNLDLDKSWGYFQRIFDSLDLPAAAELVAGDVTQTSTGWISHQGAIAPHRVEQIMAEFELVTQDDVRNLFQKDAVWHDARSEGDFDYVLSHLERALQFLKRVEGEQRGIVYYIG
jgi:hypothetical protein